MLVVVYTFDALDSTAASSMPSLTSNGNGDLTMLRRSVRSIVAGWKRYFIRHETRIEVFTNTPNQLSLYLLDFILQGFLKLRSLTKASKETVASTNSGDIAATHDQQKFKAGGAGHARVWLIPHLLRTTDNDILYCDNDTLLPSAGADEFWNLMQEMKTKQCCFAYQQEGKTCKKLLGPAYADVSPLRKTLAHRKVSSFSENKNTTPNLFEPTVLNLSCDVFVVNNGVQYYPAGEKGLLIATFVLDTYGRLPASSMQRYLHDMIALSWTWHLNPKTCLSLLNKNGDGKLLSAKKCMLHYWPQKTKPELQASFLRTLLSWRVEEDIALLFGVGILSLSADQQRELAARIITCAKRDATSLEEAAVRNGVFLKRDNARHLSKRAALRGTVRKKHPGLQPTSARLAAAAIGARVRLDNLFR